MKPPQSQMNVEAIVACIAAPRYSLVHQGPLKASADEFCLGCFDDSEVTAVARFFGLGIDKSES